MIQQTVFNLPNELWQRFIKPLPSVNGSCGTAECAVPLSAVITYAAAVLGIILLIWFIYDQISSDNPDTDSENSGITSPADGPDDDDGDSTSKSIFSRLSATLSFGDTSGSESEREETLQKPEGGGGDVEGAETDTAVDMSDPDDDTGNMSTADSDDFHDLDELHQMNVASSGIRSSWRGIQTGQYHRRIMVADPGKMDDQLSPGGLINFFSDPNNNFDMKIRFEPLDIKEAQSEAQDRADGLRDSANLFGTESDEQFLANEFIQRADKTAQLASEFEESRPYRVAIYVSARARDPETLENRVESIRRQFRRDGNIELVTLEGEQDRGLVATSPIAADPFNEPNTWHDFSFVTTARGVGALLSSATSSTVVEGDGQFWGTHALNGSPVIKNPFNSPKNYNMTVIGESGTGKSLYQKYLASSAEVLFDDTKVIVLDPLGGFTGLAEAFDVDPITVSGTQTINPLEIEKPPDEVLDSAEWADDRDPLAMKISEVKSFAQNLAAENNIKLNEELPLFEEIILEVYEEAGITRDVRTHSRDSPTFDDVFDKLDEISENVEGWMRGSAIAETERESVEHHIARLKNVFRPLRRGKYENLVGQTEVDISDQDMVYLSMEQQDTGAGGGAGVMGQILFSRIYEHAKTTPKNVIFIIDEARFLFRDNESLEFLAQRVRQSRHHNMSIRFITQEIQDFFSYEGADGIVKNSTFKIIHNIPRSTAERYQDVLGLKESHIDFIVDMNTGGENEDYSEALVQMPTESGEIRWIPVMISPSETQMAIIDFDGDEDSRADLPGVSDQIESSAIVRELRARLRTGQTVHEETLESALEEWQAEFVRFLSDDDIAEILDEIRDGAPVEQALREKAIDRLSWVANSTTNKRIANQVEELLQEGVPEPTEAADD